MGKNNLNLETNRHFTIIMDDIVYDEKLTAYEKLLYVILKTYTNKNTNTAFPSHKKLSENMNVSIFTVKKAIEGLIEKGYLKKKSGKKGIKGTKDTSNTYTLIEKISEKKELSHATTTEAWKSTNSQIDNKSKTEKSQEENPAQETGDKDIFEAGQTAQSNYSASQDNTHTLEVYEELIKKNIEYDSLCNAHPHYRKFIDDIVFIMLDVIMSEDKMITVAGERKNAELVKSVFLKLNYYQVEYVIEKYQKVTSKIKKIKQYILTMLFNARLESEASVINDVNVDMFKIDNIDNIDKIDKIDKIDDSERQRQREQDIEYLKASLEAGRGIMCN